jgi:hypothetical protein
MKLRSLVLTRMIIRSAIGGDVRSMSGSFECRDARDNSAAFIIVFSPASTSERACLRVRGAMGPPRRS